jgi:hypothetical protein
MRIGLSRIVVGCLAFYTVTTLYTYIHTTAIREVTSGELLLKQAMRKIFYYVKIHTYLSYFSKQSLTGMRHFYWGINFFVYVCGKKSATCELSHILYCEALKTA